MEVVAEAVWVLDGPGAVSSRCVVLAAAARLFAEEAVAAVSSLPPPPRSLVASPRVGMPASTGAVEKERETRGRDALAQALEALLSVVAAGGEAAAEAASEAASRAGDACWALHCRDLHAQHVAAHLASSCLSSSSSSTTGGDVARSAVALAAAVTPSNPFAAGWRPVHVLALCLSSCQAIAQPTSELVHAMSALIPPDAGAALLNPLARLREKATGEAGGGSGGSVPLLLAAAAERDAFLAAVTGSVRAVAIGGEGAASAAAAAAPVGPVARAIVANAGRSASAMLLLLLSTATETVAAAEAGGSLAVSVVARLSGASPGGAPAPSPTVSMPPGRSAAADWSDGQYYAHVVEDPLCTDAGGVDPLPRLLGLGPDVRSAPPPPRFLPLSVLPPALSTQEARAALRLESPAFELPSIVLDPHSELELAPDLDPDPNLELDVGPLQQRITTVEEGSRERKATEGKEETKEDTEDDSEKGAVDMSDTVEEQVRSVNEQAEAAAEDAAIADEAARPVREDDDASKENEDATQEAARVIAEIERKMKEIEEEQRESTAEAERTSMAKHRAARRAEENAIAEERQRMLAEVEKEPEKQGASEEVAAEGSASVPHELQLTTREEAGAGSTCLPATPVPTEGALTSEMASLQAQMSTLRAELASVQLASAHVASSQQAGPQLVGLRPDAAPGAGMEDETAAQRREWRVVLPLELMPLSAQPYSSSSGPQARAGQLSSRSSTTSDGGGDDSSGNRSCVGHNTKPRTYGGRDAAAEAAAAATRPSRRSQSHRNFVGDVREDHGGDLGFEDDAAAEAIGAAERRRAAAAAAVNAAAGMSAVRYLSRRGAGGATNFASRPPHPSFPTGHTFLHHADAAATTATSGRSRVPYAAALNAAPASVPPANFPHDVRTAEWDGSNMSAASAAAAAGAAAGAATAREREVTLFGTPLPSRIVPLVTRFEKANAPTTHLRLFTREKMRRAAANAVAAAAAARVEQELELNKLRAAKARAAAALSATLSATAAAAEAKQSAAAAKAETAAQAVADKQAAAASAAELKAQETPVKAEATAAGAAGAATSAAEHKSSSRGASCARVLVTAAATFISSPESEGEPAPHCAARRAAAPDAASPNGDTTESDSSWSDQGSAPGGGARQGGANYSAAAEARWLIADLRSDLPPHTFTNAGGATSRQGDNGRSGNLSGSVQVANGGYAGSSAGSQGLRSPIPAPMDETMAAVVAGVALGGSPLPIVPSPTSSASERLPSAPSVPWPVDAVDKFSAAAVQAAAAAGAAATIGAAATAEATATTSAESRMVSALAAATAQQQHALLEAAIRIIRETAALAANAAADPASAPVIIIETTPSTSPSKRQRQQRRDPREEVDDEPLTQHRSQSSAAGGGASPAGAGTGSARRTRLFSDTAGPPFTVAAAIARLPALGPSSPIHPERGTFDAAAAAAAAEAEVLGPSAQELYYACYRQVLQFGDLALLNPISYTLNPPS
jgi:hypothetical protein